MKLALALLLFASATAQTADEIRALLVNRVEVAKKSAGMVAGTVDAGRRSVIAVGRASRDQSRALDGDTVFEIGSITKVFTSLLLADMAERGEVKLDDPVVRYLPQEVKMPVFEDKQITLLDISKQVSGLPRLPSNMKPANPSNPYADYGPAQLYEFLSGYKLTRAPGAQYEYSNLAVGLLGHVLARRAGMSYEELVRKRILEPLGMTSTAITLSPALKQRLATGHGADLSPAPNWDLDALAGAGALRSTVNDMLKFLAAHLELTDSPLKPAIRRLRAERRPAGGANVQIGMGWHLFTQFGEVWWHNGGTGGYRSFAGFDVQRKRGAVVLSNSTFSVDDIGAHFVNSDYPAKPLPPPREAVTLDTSLLDEYAGSYELAPGFILTFTREGDRMFVQATGQSKAEVFAAKKDEFFARIVEAEFSFTRDSEGKVNGLVLHQGGRDMKAARK